MSTAIIDPARLGRASFAGGVSDRAVRATASTGRSAPRLRVTRRGRLVLAVLVGIPLAAAAWFAAGSADGAIATGDRSTYSFEYVQVESGQSLWQIASAVAPTADPREVVSEIVRLNGLASSDVFPGQRLGIPEQYQG